VVFWHATSNCDQPRRVGEHSVLNERVIIVKNLDADLRIIPLSVIVEKIPNLGIRQRRTVDGNIIVRCLLQDRIRIVECVSQFTSKRRRRPNLFVGEEILEEVVQVFL